MSLMKNAIISAVNVNGVQKMNERMATVTGVTGGLYLQFYGEDEPSSKSYKRLNSYVPAVGDVVLVLQVNKSYVVMGKVV